METLKLSSDLNNFTVSLIETKILPHAICMVVKHGFESKDMSKLLAFDHRCPKGIDWISWNDQVGSVEVKHRVPNKGGTVVDEVIRSPTEMARTCITYCYH